MLLDTSIRAALVGYDGVQLSAGVWTLDVEVTTT